MRVGHGLDEQYARYGEPSTLSSTKLPRMQGLGYRPRPYTLQTHPSTCVKFGDSHRPRRRNASSPVIPRAAARRSAASSGGGERCWCGRSSASRSSICRRASCLSASSSACREIVLFAEAQGTLGVWCLGPGYDSQILAAHSVGHRRGGKYIRLMNLR